MGQATVSDTGEDCLYVRPDVRPGPEGNFFKGVIIATLLSIPLWIGTISGVKRAWPN